MNALRKCFRQIIDNGVRSGHSIGEVHHIAVVNVLSLVYILTSLSQVPMALYYNSYYIVVLSTIPAVSYLTVFVTTHFYGAKAGAVLLGLLSNMVILINSLLLGKSAGMHFYFWGTILAPISLYWEMPKKVALFFFLFPAIGILLIESELLHTGYYPAPDLSHSIAVGVVLNCLVGIIAMAFYLVWFFRQKESKMAEQLATIQNQQIQIANNAKFVAIAEMSGGIAHEINNPLAIMSGYLSQVARELKKDNPNLEKLSLSTEKSLATIERISKIIKGLSHLSRDTQGETPSNVLASEVIESAVSICREKFQNSGIELQVIASHPGISIQCKPIQTAQVLLNLLTNAHDAVLGQEKPWVRIEVLLYDEKPASAVIFRVSDSGDGIPKDIADKIMEPFFTTKAPGKGTGLGLAISKKLIEEQAGLLTLDRSAQNTCFLVRLPIAS